MKSRFKIPNYYKRIEGLVVPFKYISQSKKNSFITHTIMKTISISSYIDEIEGEMLEINIH